MAATFLWFSNLAIAEKPPASARRTDGFRRRAASSQTSSDRPIDSRAAHRLWICCTQHLICFFRFPRCTREQHPGSGKAGHSCYTINGLNHFLREWGGWDSHKPQKPNVVSSQDAGGKKNSLRLLLQLASYFSHTAPPFTAKTNNDIIWMWPYINFLFVLFF